MASRLCGILLQRTVYCRKQLPLIELRVIKREFQHLTTSRQTNVVLQHAAPVQFLHVKIFDKDADWEAQRPMLHYRKKENNIKTEREEEIKNSEIDDSRLSQESTSEFQEKDTYTYNNDPDVFGATDGTHDDDAEDQDEGDIREEEYEKQAVNFRRKLRPIDYARRIKSHLHNNELKDALKVLETTMLKEDGAKPDKYIYNLLISGCAKAGYTHKAFNLFTRMRQRGFEIPPNIYTSLFNACANAPSAADGLSRANKLREIMLEKGVTPNVVNYNAMIKAYGRCGDVKTAYLLADQMLEERLAVSVDTFNFLLQASASDTKFGFRHSLLTWHRMLNCGLKPDYYTFHTILRCSRDCGFGDLPTTYQVIQQICEVRKEMPLDSGNKTPKMEILENKETNVEETKSVTIDSENLPESTNDQKTAVSVKWTRPPIEQLEVPNLLTRRPHYGNLIGLSEIKQPHERFLLLGGITGFLALMKQYNITPNIQLFTTMLDVIPPTYAAEKQIIGFIKKIGLKADIDFFNILIKKRSMRFDYEGAKEVLSMIRTARLEPNIVSYGVLALGCETVESAKDLMAQMNDAGIRMNIAILGAMLRQGTSKKAFTYINEIMQISLEHNIKPNDVFLRHLNTFYNQCARAIDARHPLTKKNDYKNGHRKFCEKLRLYYEEQGIAGLKLEDAIKKIKERPYDQYKEADVNGLEPTKNEKLVRKQKLRKYIKKIKLEHLRNDSEISPKSDTTDRQKSIE